MKSKFFPCPVAGCTKRRLEWQLACGACWKRVHMSTQREIWRLFRSAPGSDAHRKLCFETIAALAPKEETL